MYTHIHICMYIYIYIHTGICISPLTLLARRFANRNRALSRVRAGCGLGELIQQILV